MRGIRPSGGIVAIGICIALLGAACGTSKSAQSTGITKATSAEEGKAPGRSRGAIACHLHSCSPPHFCNKESGVCEMLPCEAKKDCPYDYGCDLSLNVCR